MGEVRIDTPNKDEMVLRACGGISINGKGFLPENIAVMCHLLSCK